MHTASGIGLSSSSRPSHRTAAPFELVVVRFGVEHDQGERVLERQRLHLERGRLSKDDVADTHCAFEAGSS